MVYLVQEDRYREVKNIKNPLLKQFEYFCLNLVDVEKIDCPSFWPREYQEDLRDLLSAIPRLERFEIYWSLRYQKKIAFLVYLAWVRDSIEV